MYQQKQRNEYYLLSSGAKGILLSIPICHQFDPCYKICRNSLSLRDSCVLKLHLLNVDTLTLEQILQNEIRESKKWLDRENDESVYKRDLEKRIELMNWVLENMKNPGVEICGLIESKMNEIILAINQTYSILEADKLHSELRILDWILYQVCVNEK